MNEDKGTSPIQLQFDRTNTTNYLLKTSKDSMLLDIPSVILNNLIDEDGEILTEGGEIPEELMKMFS